MTLTRVKTVVSVVDDDESIRKTITRIVKSDGFEIESFGSAEEFLKDGDLANSACLILDINLPGISGIDLQQQLNKSTLRIPVIFITARADTETRESAMRADAAGFLEKPFNMDSLLAAVRTTVCDGAC